MSTTRRPRRLVEEKNGSRSSAADDIDNSEPTVPAVDSSRRSENPRRQQTRSSAYNCDICDKTFSRSEHLSRHLDSHRNKKRWPCHFCQRRFSRRDVLSRHLSKCKHAAGSIQPITPRVNRACQNCSKRKVKCSGRKPCAECAKLSAECIYPFSRMSNGFAGHVSLPLDDQTSQTNDGSANSPSPLDSRVPVAGNHVMFPAQNEGQPPDSETDTFLRHQTCDGQANQRTANANNAALDFQQTHQPSPTAFLAQDVFESDLPRDFMAPDASWSSGQGAGFLDWLYFDFPPAIDGQDPIIPIANNGHHVSSETVQMTRPQSYSNPYSDNDMPNGLELARVDPLRHHHAAILHYLTDEQKIPLQQLQWLCLENMGLFIKAYFIRFHKHCPFIHLPHWSVATCSTHMIFSMILLAALYIRDTRVGVQDARKYCGMAYDFAMRADQDIREPSRLKLEILQSIFLLALLDRILANGSQKQPQINFQTIVAQARESGFLEDQTLEDDPSSPHAWEKWSFQESCRRTTFILYCFDAITSVILDERPRISTYEMHIMMPSPENLFAATSREEWVTLHREVGDANAVPYSVLLSLLHSEASEPINIPCTIMGCFILVHGILLHAWETGKYFAHRTSGPSHLLEAFKQKRFAVTQHALREWHRGWQASLQSPYCGVANSAGLYRDRSLVYWYLAGILSFPTATKVNNAANSTVPASSRNNSQPDVPVKLWMQRLISCLENGQLDSSSVSFETAQQLVESVVSEQSHKVRIGSLLFPENES